MQGNVTGGKDALSGSQVTVPPRNRRPFDTTPAMGDGMRFFDNNKSQPQMRPMTGPMSPHGQQRTLDTVRGVVAEARAAQGGVKVNDMRKPNGGDPHGVNYLNRLSEAYREQSDAKFDEQRTGNPRDYSKVGDDYAKREAEARSTALTPAGGASPDWMRNSKNISSVLIPDSKYGNSVGFATKGPTKYSKDFGKDFSAEDAALRESIAQQDRKPTPAPEVLPPAGSGVTGIMDGYKKSLTKTPLAPQGKRMSFRDLANL